MNFAALQAELTGDPLARGYAAMSDAAAAADLNLVNRDGPRPPGILREYLLLNRYRSNNGTDTTLTPIWGRLELLAEAAVGSDPFGRADAVTMVHIHAARMLLELARADAIEAIDFAGTEVDDSLSNVAGGSGARAMAPSDFNAIKALSQNQQSRAQELGLRAPVRESDVTKARAL